MFLELKSLQAVKDIMNCILADVLEVFNFSYTIDHELFHSVIIVIYLIFHLCNGFREFNKKIFKTSMVYFSKS